MQKILWAVFFVSIFMLFVAIASASTLVIPVDATRIDEEAFYGDTSIDEVILPENLQTIGARAFAKSGLQKVFLPDSLDFIADDAFEADVVISANEGTAAFDWAVANGYISFRFEPINETTCRIKEFIGLQDEVIIPLYSPDGLLVTEIGAGAFSGYENLLSIAIPESVKVIGGSAFEGCKSLGSITIPNGVTQIEAWTFADCGNLASIIIPDSVNSIGPNAFRSCENLISVTIPDGVTIINQMTFYNCASLRSVTLPDSLTRIGPYAFYYCSDLTDITIPNDVTQIGMYAFARCLNLTDIVIPFSVREIGNYVFYDCERLTNVMIPDTVTRIGTSAFEMCMDLTDITLPAGLMSIGSSAFQTCMCLTDITIPEGTKSIGSNAFKTCVNLSSITIPFGVGIIHSTAFTNCPALTILCYEGSEAEQFAWEQGIKYLKLLDAPSVIQSIGFPRPHVFNIFFDGFDGDVEYGLYQSTSPNGPFILFSNNSYQALGCYLFTSFIQTDNIYYRIIGNNHCTTLFSPYHFKTNFRYEEISDTTIKITGWEALDYYEMVEVPSSIDGKQVVDIDPDTFKRFSNLQTIILPESLIELKDTLNLPSSNTVVSINHYGAVTITSIEKCKSGLSYTHVYIYLDKAADNGDQTYELYKSDSLNGDYHFVTDALSYHFGKEGFPDSYQIGTEAFYKVKVIGDEWSYYTEPVSVDDPAMNKTICRGLVIINQHYETNDDQTPDPDQPNADENRSAISSIMSSAYGYYPVRIVNDVLLQDFSMLLEVTAFGDADDNDISVIYLCAHGTSDPKAEDWGSFETSDSLSCSPEDLKGWLKTIPGKKVLLLDSCGSGGFAEEYETENDIVAITACAKDQNSYGKRGEPSYFVKALVDAVQ